MDEFISLILPTWEMRYPSFRWSINDERIRADCGNLHIAVKTPKKESLLADTLEIVASVLTEKVLECYAQLPEIQEAQ